jgi:hypothetical protein
MRRRTAWLLSLAGGGLVAGGTHLLAGPGLALTAALAASYAAVVRLSLAHPDTVYEPGTPAWTVGRWSGLSVGFLLAVAVVAPLGLPAAPGPRFTLRLLLVGAGYAMWLLGISYARAKAPPGAGATASRSEN